MPSSDTLPQRRNQTGWGEPESASVGTGWWKAETGSSSDQKGKATREREMHPSFKAGEKEAEYTVDKRWQLRL